MVNKDQKGNQSSLASAVRGSARLFWDLFIGGGMNQGEFGSSVGCKSHNSSWLCNSNTGNESKSYMSNLDHNQFFFSSGDRYSSKPRVVWRMCVLNMHQT
jgi:hypothetical protein